MRELTVRPSELFAIAVYVLRDESRCSCVLGLVHDANEVFWCIGEDVSKQNPFSFECPKGGQPRCCYSIVSIPALLFSCWASIVGIELIVVCVGAQANLYLDCEEGRD